MMDNAQRVMPGRRRAIVFHRFTCAPPQCEDIAAANITELKNGEERGNVPMKAGYCFISSLALRSDTSHPPALLHLTCIFLFRSTPSDC